jgi:CDP-glycerol glycerophosphotransferase (TagB/SpsB family)
MNPRRMKSFIGSILDFLVPINNMRVVFVAKSRVPFAGNLRAVADELLLQGGKQVLIYKDGLIDTETRAELERAGAIVLSGFSIVNLWKVLSCGTVFVGHSIRDAHITRRKHGRKIVNLWHGVPLKRIELLMGQGGEGPAVKGSHLRIMQANAALYDHVIASGPDDIEIMANAFGVPQTSVIARGLPRFDYMDPHYMFPADLVRQGAHFLNAAAKRRVVLYAPTFREECVSPLRALKGATLDALRRHARAHNVVYAIRPHPYDNEDVKTLVAANADMFIDASVQVYPEMAIVIRNTDILVTDYSSIWVDFLLMKRPVLALVPDIVNYTSKERGFIRPLNEYFPGPVCKSWEEILERIAKSDYLPASRPAKKTRRVFLNLDRQGFGISKGVILSIFG